MRYDPKFGFIAQGVPDHAVGTVDELERAKMPTDVFHTCHAELARAGIRGCPLEAFCNMSYKGKSLAEGGGPRNHGWEHIKGPQQGGNVVRGVHPCFWGVAQQEAVQENHGVLRVIADEGEEIEVLTGVQVPKPNDPLNREDRLVKVKVEPFTRIGERKEVAQNMLRASVLKQEQERSDHERAGEVLGVVGGGTPLDQRGRGSREGRAAKG